MPVVNIELNWLNRLVGQDLPPDQIQDSLEQLGCDVEEIVEIVRSRCSFCGALVEHPIGQDELKLCSFCGQESDHPFQTEGAEQVVRLDLLAARPDLFDIGGLSRALKGSLGLARGLPDYSVQVSDVQVVVDPSVARAESYRPFIACALVTFPQVDENTLVAVMKLQENLHWGVGRDRKLASIGVYDLETVRCPIHYTTIAPEVEFVPLGMPGKRISAAKILTAHAKGAAYAHLLGDFRRYPVLIDDSGQILSMPPIINSEETKVRRGSSALFIDVTGISKAAVVKSLDTLVASLAELGGVISTVSMRLADGSIESSPDVSPRSKEVSLDAAKRWLGLPLVAESLVDAMKRMRFDIEKATNSEDRFFVKYPPYRTDIRHMVDLFEDVAIGYGYENIVPDLVPSLTIGSARPEEQLSELIRLAMLGHGFHEVMSLPLKTEEEEYLNLCLEVPKAYPGVSNPKLKERKVLRSRLLPGLLEALHENRRRPLPLCFFELDNVTELKRGAETGVVERRSVAIVQMGAEAGFARIRAIVDSLFRELAWELRYFPMEHASFVPGRVAELCRGKESLGILGEVHPQVLTNVGLRHPVVAAEVSLAQVF